MYDLDSVISHPYFFRTVVAQIFKYIICPSCCSDNSINKRKVSTKLNSIPDDVDCTACCILLLEQFAELSVLDTLLPICSKLQFLF